jgi:hypothetical protein
MLGKVWHQSHCSNDPLALPFCTSCCCCTVASLCTHRALSSHGSSTNATAAITASAVAAYPAGCWQLALLQAGWLLLLLLLSV